MSSIIFLSTCLAGREIVKYLLIASVGSSFWALGLHVVIKRISPNGAGTPICLPIFLLIRSMAALSAANWTDTVVRRPLCVEPPTGSSVDPRNNVTKIRQLQGADNFTSRLGLIWISRVKAIEKAEDRSCQSTHLFANQLIDGRISIQTTLRGGPRKVWRIRREKEGDAKKSSVLAEKVGPPRPNQLGPSCPRLPLSDHCREHTNRRARHSFVVLAFLQSSN
jgi:hypothetical protein